MLGGDSNEKGGYEHTGEDGYYWSWTDYSAAWAVYATVDKDLNNFTPYNTTNKNYGFSLRCVKEQ
jgi:uncharacterized protein (TIGR02145 family)